MNVLHQGADILINSIDVVTIMTNLTPISNIQIPTCCIAILLTKLTGKCIVTTPFILEMEIVETMTIESSQLFMTPMIHFKDEGEPAQVLLTLVNLSDIVV